MTTEDTTRTAEQGGTCDCGHAVLMHGDVVGDTGCRRDGCPCKRLRTSDNRCDVCGTAWTAEVDVCPTPHAAEIERAREVLNETMISLQSALSTHLCDRLHDADERGEDPCVACVESAADLLGDTWDQRVLDQLLPPSSTCDDAGPPIGENGPRCRLPQGHVGVHQNVIEDGFGRVISW